MKHTLPDRSGDAVDHFLSSILQNYDQATLVFFITIASLLSSVLLTAVAALSLDGIELIPSITVAATVPLVVAPFISWKLVGLFVRLEKMERKMRDLATYDSLTGLLTRQAFFHDAQNYLDLAERNRDPFVAMMLDLDHFKMINDTFGHQVGDRVLEHFGSFLKRHFRKSDIIGRLGGEEFAVILPHTLPGDALKIAETLRSDLEKEPWLENNARIPVTVSIGVATHAVETPARLNPILKEADTALYEAKNSGRNCTAVFDEALETSQIL